MLETTKAVAMELTNVWTAGNESWWEGQKEIKGKKRGGKEILFSSLGFPFKFQGSSGLSLLSHRRRLLIPFHYFFVSKYQGSGKRDQGETSDGQRDAMEAFPTRRRKPSHGFCNSKVEWTGDQSHCLSTKKTLFQNKLELHRDNGPLVGQKCCWHWSPSKLHCQKLYKKSPFYTCRCIQEWYNNLPH